MNNFKLNQLEFYLLSKFHLKGHLEWLLLSASAMSFAALSALVLIL